MSPQRLCFTLRSLDLAAKARADISVWTCRSGHAIDLSGAANHPLPRWAKKACGLGQALSDMKCEARAPKMPYTPKWATAYQQELVQCTTFSRIEFIIMCSPFAAGPVWLETPSMAMKDLTTIVKHNFNCEKHVFFGDSGTAQNTIKTQFLVKIRPPVCAGHVRGNHSLKARKHGPEVRRRGRPKAGSMNMWPESSSQSSDWEEDRAPRIGGAEI